MAVCLIEPVVDHRVGGIDRFPFQLPATLAIVIRDLPPQQAHKPCARARVPAERFDGFDRREKRLLHEFLGQVPVPYARQDVPKQVAAVLIHPRFDDVGRLGASRSGRVIR